MMNKVRLTHTMIAALAILVAAWIMSAGAAAEPLHIHDAIQRPNVYAELPDLWEFLNDEGRITWTDTPAVEPNDDSAHAMTVSDGMQINGHVDNASDLNDYYKVVFTGPTSLFARLTWPGSAWLNLYIYDAALTPITYLNENTPSPKYVNIWQHNAGTYYVRVKSLAGASDYQLRIGIAGQNGETDNDALDTTGINVSAFNEPVKQIIDTSSDPVDYYMVNIPQGCKSASITLDWFGTQDANLDFDVFGPNGGKISTTAQSTNFETLYSQNVPADTYYIAVRSVVGRAMYQLVVDSEIELHIRIPRYEMEVPIWGPPWPWDDLLLEEELRLF